MGMKQSFLLGGGLLVVAVVATAWLSKQTEVPLLSPAQKQAVASAPITDQRREPISIARVREPDEMLVEPLPINSIEPTAPERELAEATDNFSKVNLTELLPALDRILTKYPDFAEGYVFRLHAFCELNEPQKVISDINNALKLMTTSRPAKDTDGSLAKDTSAALLSMRAKLKYAYGDYSAAMDDLDKAIGVDLAKAKQFTNSGAVEPEKTASSVCVWTLPDMDALVRRFPTDYRTYLFRGLYYSFFVTFSHDDDLLNRALDDFRKAAERNAGSALPHFFAAQAILQGSFFKQLSMSDEKRTDIHRAQLDELNKALMLDPDLQPALTERADVNFHLKQFRKAIADWDRTIALDSKNYGAFNDRGLNRMELGDTYGAISDFDEAIHNRGRELLHTYSYEARAEAYMKSRQWDRAIRDLTTAISLQVGGSVLLMNIDQFRALYPEYEIASDETVARKLQQTFYPNLKYEGFIKSFFSQRPLSSTIIPDLYVKRADAYLKKGDWHRAAIDFRRAIKGFPDYANAVERWREIGQTTNAQNYIDLKTFDDADNASIKLWTKEVSGRSESIGPYTLQRFELNCAARQLRPVSFATYDASGNLTRSREFDKWQSIIPETFGEVLYSGACRS
jgi:tetratricopeptide (TPR) repeat protein